MICKHRFRGCSRALLLLFSLFFALAPIHAQDDPPAVSLEPEVGHLLPVSASAEAPAAIRIVSFNVRLGMDLPGLIESILENPNLRSADLFLLQEIESYPAEGTSRTRKLAEALKLNYYVYGPARPTETEGKPGTHGLAILSRYPLSDFQIMLLPRLNLRYKSRQRIALAATADVAGWPLRVYNVHLDTRANTRSRIKQLTPVVEAAGGDGAPAQVIGGDFNTNPFRWLWSMAPIFRSNQARAVDNFMSENGFQTSFAKAGHTSRKGFFLLRLDSLYTRGVRWLNHAIERSVKSSDHAPLWIDIAWPPETEDAAAPDTANR